MRHGNQCTVKRAEFRVQQSRTVAVRKSHKLQVTGAIPVSAPTFAVWAVNVRRFGYGLTGLP